MTTKSSPTTYGHIWKIAWPILICLVAEHLILLTDTAFLGRVGEIELGASALAGVLYLAVFMLGFGFSLGGQILIGRRNGEKNYAETGIIVVQGGIFMLLAAIPVFLLTRLCAPALLHGILASEQVWAAAVSYLDTRVWGFFGIFPALMFRGFFVGIERTKCLSYNSIAMVGVNVVLNYGLIFGRLGMPKMGIAGAGLASSIAEIASLAFFIIYVRLFVDTEKYGFQRAWRPKPRLVLKILGVSIWMMIQYLVGVGLWFLFFVAVEHLGERPIAVSNIVRSFATMLFMPVSAMAAAAVTITSNLMGAGEHDKVMGSCARAIKLCCLIILPIAAAAFIFPEPFIRVYTDNAELAADSVASMRVMATAFVVIIPACILFQTVSGTGNTRSALLMDLGPFALSALFVYFVVVKWKMDVAVCWLNEHVYWFLVMLISYIYMKKADWRSKKL